VCESLKQQHVSGARCHGLPRRLTGWVSLSRKTQEYEAMTSCVFGDQRNTGRMPARTCVVNFSAAFQQRW
jgi:hypothetical protein